MNHTWQRSKHIYGLLGLAMALGPLAARVAAEEAPKEPVKVRVLPLKKTASEKALKLTGESRPYASVTLYAMCSGVVTDVLVDKGTKVKKGQILAIIDAPDVEKQYSAALAEANYKKTISNRSMTLKKKKLISSQEADQAESEYEIAKAKLETLEVLRACESIRAPFDGTISNRFVDNGALVQNGINSPSAQPVLALSQVDQLRVYVYVSQKEANFVTVGTPVMITVPEQPGIEIKATVSRMPAELDPKSKTLLVEVDVDNSKGTILAGGYVNAMFKLKIPGFLQIPTDVLVSKGDKTMVPLLNAESKIEMRPVTVFDNDGRLLTISSGLKEGEVVAIAPGKELNNGDKVIPIVPEAKPEDKKAAVAPADKGTANRNPTADNPAKATTSSGPANPMGSLK